MGSLGISVLIFMMELKNIMEPLRKCFINIGEEVQIK